MSLPLIDVVDLRSRLHKDFPHVEFIVVEEEIKNNTFYRFKLVKLLNQKFETPIKTNIYILKNSYLNEEEYYEIKELMMESFNKIKLLGLA